VQPRLQHTPARWLEMLTQAFRQQQPGRGFVMDWTQASKTRQQLADESARAMALVNQVLGTDAR